MLLSSFSNVEIRAQGSSITVFFRTVAVWLSFFSKPRILNKLIRCTLVPLLNITGQGLETVVQTSNNQFAANFSIRAQK